MKGGFGHLFLEMESIFLEKLNIDKSFQEFFDRNDIKNELVNIQKKINGEVFYPNANEVLRFANVDLTKVKCIILGMDPYPSSVVIDGIVYPVATGRSFEVRGFNSWLQKFKETSLQNILKTLYLNENKSCSEKLTLTYIREKIISEEFKILEPNILWNNLEEQGVMWLNATLTVRKGVSDSHTTYWKFFMDELLKYMVRYKKDKYQDNIKWLIWGKKAMDRILNIVDEKDIVYTCHPASRINNTFVQDNCFQYVKDIKWIGK